MSTPDHRTQVREFLTSRRGRITPQQAGLPAYGGANRRVKGLRREEVALLAGVSLDYYVRMERGQLGGASEQVLDGVADALQLDEAEREHLYALARAAGPSRHRTRPTDNTVRPVIRQILEAVTDAPAWVRNGRHDILAMNPLARALYSPVVESSVAGAVGKRPANTTRFMFLDPAAPDFFIEYDRMAADAAAMLRLEAGRSPHDGELHTLVGELSTQSELFRKHWASQNVKFHRSGRKRLRHPVIGELELNFESLEMPSDPSLRLNIYTADADTPAADGLKLLSSWAATHRAEGFVESRTHSHNSDR